MQTVSVKEFRNKLADYIEEAYAGEEIVVTKRGVEYVKLIRSVHLEPKVYPKTTEEVAEVYTLKTGCLEYGCGCAKVSGNNLCPKHSRI